MTFKSKARRAGWLLVVAVFAFGIVSAVRPEPVDAYGLLSTRYIRMSSSEAGTNNNIYSVGFTTVTANQSVGSILIRICAGSPIIGEAACVAPTNFTFNPGTLSLNNLGGTSNLTTGGLTVATASNANNLLLTRTSGQAAITNGTVFFDLGNGTTNGVRNPDTTNTTFFARIMLFSGTTNALPTITSDDENATDAGGVALSTANVLNVTAKVQESLTFCVYTQTNCAGGGNEVRLGTSENVLAAMNTVYTDATPKFDLASNALAGVIVRLKGDTLTSGAFTISPHGEGAGGACVPDVTTTSTEQFGLRIVTYGAGHTFGGLAANDADDFSCLAGNHKFNPTRANTTYGQPFVKTVGATDVSTTNFELAAKAANTTEAGVYTTKLQFIATATY